MKVTKEMEGKLRQEARKYLWPVSKQPTSFMTTITLEEMVDFAKLILVIYAKD